LKHAPKETSSEESVRLDKWLWAARFFKTRAVAKEAIGGGKVELNRKRAKPSREVRLGDHLVITREHERYEIKVTGLSARRGPASVAATLYEESESSIERRRAQLEQRALERRAAPTAPDRRPDKRSRRRIIRFTRKGEN
jgi:ribosome-associated heat shock protein Hsp15